MHGSRDMLAAMFRRCHRWWLGTLFALGVGCLSPTLPLPPPADPEIDGPNEQGVVTLSGTVARAEALILAYNNRTRHADGDRADTTGHYAFQMEARAGDSVVLWYEYAAEESLPRDFVIPSPVITGKPPAFSSPTVTGPSSAGQYNLFGVIPEPGARVYVLLRRTSVITGTIADAAGAYSIELAANAGDQLEIWYQGTGAESEHLSISL